jgi:catecholate siderophore receptor
MPVEQNCARNGIQSGRGRPEKLFTANYIHTNLHGLPDFGVPYYRPGSPAPGNIYTNTAGGPFPDFGVNRNNFYGFVNRDYYSIKQDIGTANLEVTISPELTVSNKTRLQRSVLDYIGTLPENPIVTNPNPALWTLSANPQSRYQVTDVFANQSEAAFKFDTGPWKHAAVAA